MPVKELAKAASQGLRREMVPGKYTRSLIGKEETFLTFEEDTLFHVLQGVASSCSAIIPRFSSRRLYQARFNLAFSNIPTASSTTLPVRSSVEQTAPEHGEKLQTYARSFSGLSKIFSQMESFKSDFEPEEMGKKYQKSKAASGSLLPDRSPQRLPGSADSTLQTPLLPPAPQSHTALFLSIFFYPSLISSFSAALCVQELL